MSCSASAGMPGRPSSVRDERRRASIRRLSAGSSQCCIRTASNILAYCSALRMTEASATPTPSSLNAIAPRDFIEPISASSLPFAALGDRADGIDIGKPDALRFAADEIDLPLVVERRLGVGHAADGGEPPRHRGRGAGGDRLFFLIAGLAEVNVNVDQAGRDETAGRVDDAIGRDPSGEATLPSRMKRSPFR